MIKYLLLLTCIFLASCQAAPARKISTAGAAEKQELADRWEKAVEKLPDFLRERRDDEAIYAGQPLPPEESRAILNSDNDKVRVKISDLLGDDWPFEIVHQMKRKRLVETLRAGALVARNGQYGSNSESESRPGVYLEIMKWDSDRHLTWGDVELVFSTAVLNREDYFINPSWNYGTFDIYSAAPAWNKGRVKYYLQTYLPKRVQNEVVYPESLDFSNLVGINVKKGQKGSMVQELMQSGLPHPKFWNSWEDGVFEK